MAACSRRLEVRRLLVFVDESGKLHPNDRARNPVIVATCIPEQHFNRITRQMYAIKQNVGGNSNPELKANRLLTRGTFRRIPEKRE